MSTTIQIGTLKNKYLFIRHGQSHNNIKKVVNFVGGSDFDRGLTFSGKKSVFTSAYGLAKDQNRFARIFSSPLLRTRETAEIVARTLGIPCVIDDRLIERQFNNYDGRENSIYETVWRYDRIGKQFESVEDTESVASRAVLLISSCEEAYQNETILFCSHGDVASITLSKLKVGDTKFHNITHPVNLAKVIEVN